MLNDVKYILLELIVLALAAVAAKVVGRRERQEQTKQIRGLRKDLRRLYRWTAQTLADASRRIDAHDRRAGLDTRDIARRAGESS